MVKCSACDEDCDKYYNLNVIDEKKESPLFINTLEYYREKPNNEH